jgi:D-alanine-D-alanine ligase
MLVKHQNGYGSVGITPASLVTDRASLARQVDHMLEVYGGALVEEFIEGREYMVLVAEGVGVTRTYPAVESLFPAGETFKHFDLKWRREGLTSGPVQDRALAARLEAACAAVFRQMGGAGYARCDVREDARGELFVIDVNPNPVLFSPPDDPGAADRILQLSPGGHAAFLANALEVARARCERRGAAAAFA